MRLEKPNILAVDDTPANLIAIEAIFENVEVNLITASSEVMALEKLGATEFALALLDAQMPGIGGLGLAKRMAEDPATEDTPVIIVTAMHKEKGLIQKGYESGAVDYVLKPFDPDILRAKAMAFVRLYLHRKELEDATREQLHIRDKFLSHVSHELRTPLNAASQFLQIIEGRMAGPISEQQEEFLTAAIRNIDDMSSMISELMCVIRSENDKMPFDVEPVSIGHIARSATMLLPKGAEIYIEDDIPMAIGEPRRLRQIFGNLIENASFYGGGAKRVSVVTDRDNQEMVRVTVSDDGPGVPVEMRESIFERMVQGADNEWESRRGLGLGLYLCRQMIEAMNGKIWVSEGLKGGADFCFTIPMIVLLSKRTA